MSLEEPKLIGQWPIFAPSKVPSGLIADASTLYDVPAFHVIEVKYKRWICD